MILKHLLSHKFISKRIAQGCSLANYATNQELLMQERLYNKQLRFNTIDNSIAHINFIGPNPKQLQAAENNNSTIRQVRLQQPNYSMIISLVARNQEFSALANRQRFYFKMMEVFKLGVWSPKIHGDQFYCDINGNKKSKTNSKILPLKLLLNQKNKKGKIIQKQSLKQNLIQQSFNEIDTIAPSNATYQFKIIDTNQATKKKFELKSSDMIFLQQTIRNIMRKLNGMQIESICQRNINKKMADEISQLYYKYQT